MFAVILFTDDLAIAHTLFDDGEEAAAYESEMLERGYTTASYSIPEGTEDNQYQLRSVSDTSRYVYEDMGEIPF